MHIKEFYPYCKEALHLISDREDCCIILFTSSYPSAIFNGFTRWFEDNGIYIDYLNQNPECFSDKRVDFTTKFYYDILLDDKAGFEISDWESIYNEVKGWK